MRVSTHEPAFVSIAVVTMALGIGLTTTLFSVAQGVLFKPLPWPDPARIVRLSETRDGRAARIRGTITNGTFLAWRDRSDLVESLGAYNTSTLTLVPTDGDPARVQVGRVTPSIFAVLRARPERGRLFDDSDAPMGTTGAPDTPSVAVLSFGAWQQWFGGADSAVGRTIRLDGLPFSIVGVMPRDFRFPDHETRVWIPMAVGSVLGDQGVRRISIFSGIARMKAGVTPEQVSAEGTARARSAPDPGLAATAMFGSSGPPDILATPLLDAITADVKPAIVLMLAAVVLLLLTATANVAGVQLARATTKRRELAVRAAIGASGAQLTRQLVLENLLLGAAGGAAGLLLSVLLHDALPWLLPPDFPRVADISIEPRVLVFAVIASLAVGVACGVTTAWQLRRLELMEILADGGAATSGAWHTRTGRTRSFIMAAQVAIACVLLVGAALLIRSFTTLVRGDRGYDPVNVLTARLDLPASYATEGRLAFADGLMERMAAAGGVERVAVGNALPFVSGGGNFAFQMPSPHDAGVMQRVQTLTRVVSPGYFAALRLRIVAGRAIDATDTLSSRPALVVNRTFAQQYLGPTPLGSRVPMSFGEHRPDADVVGIVDDMRQGDLNDAPTPEVFLSYRQMPQRLNNAPLIVVVRTQGDPVAVIPMLQAAVRDLDREVALDSVMTMDTRVMTSLARQRTYAVILGAFAICAALIAGVGLFGVLSYTIAQRAREIGLRTALGAQQRQIVQLVLRQGVVTAIAGIVAGLAMAVAGAKALTPLLFGVSTYDVASFAAVAVSLLAVVMAACIIPARRAAKLDPLVALRRP